MGKRERNNDAEFPMYSNNINNLTGSSVCICSTIPASRIPGRLAF